MSKDKPPVFGPYTGQRLLGTGGQARVWLASGPEGEVAVKEAKQQKDKKSLKVEIDLLQRGDHPGLVKLYGFDPDGAWMATERIRGTLLSPWASKRGLDEIRNALHKLIATIAHLHELGAVHGDIKPNNILVESNGQTRLLDLGIATLNADKQASFRGTLGYVAPEILQGKPPTSRSDLYSLGAVAYECVTGRMPFVAPDPAALAYLPMVSLPLAPSALCPSLPRLWDEFILDLLCRDPRHRAGPAMNLSAKLAELPIQINQVPFVGMEAQRTEIGKAVMGAVDGECRVVVVYGPPGSGRRKLIQEGVREAKRVGLHPKKGVEVSKALQAGQRLASKPVMALPGNHASTLKIAQQFLQQKQAGLLFIRADKPIAKLFEQSVQITPAPLSLHDAETMAEALGIVHVEIQSVWLQSEGSPSSLLSALAGYIPASDSSVKWELPRSKATKEILTLLKQAGELEIPDLASRLSMHEHEVLDHILPLLAEGTLRSNRHRIGLTAGYQP